jgi:hypothetical protein
MGINAIAEKVGTLPDRPVVVGDASVREVIDHHNCKIIRIEGCQTIDYFLTKTF